MSESDDYVHTGDERAPRGELLRAGTIAGDYVIEGFLARGGCGSVYTARHRALGRSVAVKVLHGSLAVSPRMVERFVREVEVVGLLRHPSIVEIHEIGALADGRPFYAMELLTGATLDVILARGRRLDPAEALAILEPVCAALDAAHAAGVVHRDVKASNIAVEAGPPRRVKLLDFGIAKLTSPEAGASGLTSAGRAIGTPTIMAPEQILGGPVDARVDVYALGVLLYRMLAGKLPFEARDAAELARLHLEEPPPRPSLRAPVPPAFDAVVLRAMEKRPERRFESAGAFLAALEAAVGRPGGEAERPREAAATGVGIRVELTTDREPDDLALDDVGRALDLAEARLALACFALASATGNQVLGVRRLPDDPVEAARARRAALAIAAALHDELALRPSPAAGVRAVVRLHVAPALFQGSGREIEGSELGQLGAWEAEGEVLGVLATKAALAGLGPDEVTLVSG